MMDVGRIKEFLFLADTLSFSETSKRFYMSQSVLSKHIAAMEDELECKLFDRDSHHVNLTDQGRAFRDEAQAIVAHYDNVITRIAAINASYETSVLIGYLRNAARPILATFVTEMARSHPEVRKVLRCMEYGDMMRAFDAGSLDMVITLDVNRQIAARCERMPIYHDQFYAVVARNHPLAERESITSSDLAGCKLLLPESATYSGMYDFVRNILPDGTPKGGHGVYRDVDTLFLKVETEGYVGFSSGHNKPAFGSEVKFLEITDKPCAYDVCAFAPKASFDDAARKCFEAFEVCSRVFAKRYSCEPPAAAEALAALQR